MRLLKGERGNGRVRIGRSMRILRGIRVGKVRVRVRCRMGRRVRWWLIIGRVMFGNEWRLWIGRMRRVRRVSWIRIIIIGIERRILGRKSILLAVEWPLWRYQPQMVHLRPHSFPLFALHPLNERAPIFLFPTTFLPFLSLFHSLLHLALFQQFNPLLQLLILLNQSLLPFRSHFPHQFSQHPLLFLQSPHQLRAFPLGVTLLYLLSPQLIPHPLVHIRQYGPFPCHLLLFHLFLPQFQLQQLLLRKQLIIFTLDLSLVLLTHNSRFWWVNLGSCLLSSQGLFPHFLLRLGGNQLGRLVLAEMTHWGRVKDLIH